MSVVIKEVGYFIAHVPDLVQYGSKPSRDIQEDGGMLQGIKDHLRTYEDAVRYAPHQVFIGNRHPDDLNNVAKPWYDHPLEDGKRNGPFGEIMPEDEFYGWMKMADDFNLFWVDSSFIAQIRDKIAVIPGCPIPG